MGYIQWTKEKVLESAKKYSSLTPWVRECSRAYFLAKRDGYLEEAISHMKRPPSASFKWSDEKIMEVIGRYETVSDFKKAELSLYTYLSKLKKLKHYTQFLKPYKREPIRSEADLRAILSNYQSVSELRKQNRTIYNYIVGGKHRGLLSLLERSQRPPKTLTKEFCTEIAKSYNRFTDFYDNENSVYLTAQRAGFLKEITAHMSRKIHSKPEEDLASFIGKHFETERQFKVKIEGRKYFKLDIYIPSLKLAIEHNGLYHHSSAMADKMSCFNRRVHLESVGVKMIVVNGDEWKYKRAIVESLILAKTGLSQYKISARKLSLKEVPNDIAQAFLEDNHLMGGYKAASHIGLYLESELLCLIGYKKHKNGIDISRFCSKMNYSVIAGLSRLLKAVERACPDSHYIQSWVDLRYGDGNSLLKCGFEKTKVTLGWKWTDRDKTYNRLKCRANMDSRKLSEDQYAKELGYYRIYDAGQALFAKKIKKD